MFTRTHADTHTTVRMFICCLYNEVKLIFTNIIISFACLYILLFWGHVCINIYLKHNCSSAFVLWKKITFIAACYVINLFTFIVFQMTTCTDSLKKSFYIRLYTHRNTCTHTHIHIHTHNCLH